MYDTDCYRMHSLHQNVTDRYVQSDYYPLKSITTVPYMSHWALCFWLKHNAIRNEQYSLIGISSKDPEYGALGKLEVTNNQ